MGRIKAALRVTYGNPSEPSEDLLRLFGYEESASGVTVTESTALGISAYYACARVIAEDVASLPLPVYRRLRPTGKERAPDHPLYRLLHDEPNPEMQAMSFREVITSHAVTWGNGFAEIERTNAGTIKHLWPLRPDHMRMERREGRLYYLYTVGGTTYVLLPHQVLHIHGLGFDGIVGYSVARVAAQSLGLAAAMDDYASRVFANGAMPRGVIEQSAAAGVKPLTDESIRRLRTQWDETYSGLSNAHRVAILEQGLTYNALGMPPEDTQLLESRKYSGLEICRWFRMQPHKVQMLDRATWNNIESENINHGIDTIRPWCVRWEQAIAARLLTPQERRDYTAEHVMDAIMRGDMKSRYEAHSLGIQSGHLSPNDVAELENRNPIEGGDEHFIPLNLIPLRLAATVAEGTQTGPVEAARGERTAIGLARLRAAYEPAVAAGFRSLAADERRAVMSGPATLGDTSDAAVEVEAALRTTYAGLTRSIRHIEAPAAAYFAALQDMAADLGFECGGLLAPECGSYIAVHARRYLRDGLDTLLSLLIRPPEDLAEVMGHVFGRWQSEGRSARYVGPLMDALDAVLIPAAYRPPEGGDDA